LNERIRVSPIRLIDHNQVQRGVVSIDEALAIAREAGMDLVEVSPQEAPPVCRIMDYGKHLYERKKRQKVATQAHATTLKEIRIRPKTDTHDRIVKLTHAREFLDHGHKVQFTMLFRGRERFFKERATELFSELINELGEAAKVERPPMMDGRRMTMVLSPGKKKAGSSSPQSPPASAPAKPAPPPIATHTEKA
jgi:translation initiation factor IF-3